MTAHILWGDHLLHSERFNTNEEVDSLLSQKVTIFLPTWRVIPLLFIIKVVVSHQEDDFSPDQVENSDCNLLEWKLDPSWLNNPTKF